MMKGKIMVCRAEVDEINANWDLRSGVNIPRLWEPGPPGVMTQTGMVMARHLTHQWLSESNTSSHVCNFQPKWERKFPLSCHPILAKFRRKKDFKLTDDKYLMINYIRRCGGNYTRHWNTLCEIYLFSNRELSRYYRQSESQQEQKILFLDLNIFDNKIPGDKDACVVERWNDRTQATSIDQTWHVATPTSFQHPNAGGVQKSFLLANWLNWIMEQII